MVCMLWLICWVSLTFSVTTFLISTVAPLVRAASCRTSSATTAKPRPHVAGASHLDGGVEGQQVGLFGDALDGGDDVLDVLGLVGELGNQADGGVDHRQGLGRQGDGLVEGVDAAGGNLRGLFRGGERQLGGAPYSSLRLTCSVTSMANWMTLIIRPEPSLTGL